MSATAFLDRPVQLAPLLPYFGHAVKARLIDLSAGGMSLVMNELIPHGTHLSLNILFPDHSLLEATALVKHVRPMNKNYLHGLEFLSLSGVMSDKIDRMSADFIDCENRIQRKEQDICKLNCHFYTMCTKPQRRDPVFDVDIALELVFRELKNIALPIIKPYVVIPQK